MPSPLRRTRSWDLILSSIGIAAAALTMAASLHLSGKVHTALDKLQNESNAARVASVLQAIDQNVHHLRDYTSGYAMWDDAYRFMEDRNPEFLQSNYEETVLAATPVQLVCIYDLKGEMIFSVALNEEGKTIPTPVGLKDFPTLEGFETLKKPEDYIGRVEWVGERPYLLTICPISDSIGMAPINGYLLFGTIIDQAMLERLQTLTGSKVSAGPDKNFAQGDFQIATPDLGPAEVTIETNPGSLRAKASALFREDNDVQQSVLFHIDLPVAASQTGAQLGEMIRTAFLLVAAGFALFMGLAIREIFYRRAEINRRILESEELHQARLEAERLADKAAAADKTKSAFLAMISHEIRTPLNAIIGYADLVRENPAEELEERLEIVSKSAGALKRIVEDILDFSKIEAGKLNIHQRPTHIRNLVTETVNAFQRMAQAKGNLIISKCDPSVPEFVMLDDFRVKQVLGNLVSNAVKFTNAGSILISLTSQPAQPKPNSDTPPSREDFILQIAVEDEGIGVSKKEETALFESFSQADSTATRRYEGTGLGLVICQRLCLLMGGDIVFQRRAVRGSRFTISLPSHPTSATEIAAPEPPPQVPHENDLSILIVDDNAVNARLLQAILKRMGRSSDIVLSGEEAVAHFQEKSPDVIFMDIHMPGMDGIATTFEIRKLEKENGRPPCIIIAVTADTLVADRASSLSAGMDGHINKPVNGPEIGATLLHISSEKAR